MLSSLSSAWVEESEDKGVHEGVGDCEIWKGNDYELKTSLYAKLFEELICLR